MSSDATPITAADVRAAYACGNAPKLGDVVAWDKSCGRIGGLFINLHDEYLVLSIDFYQDHPRPVLDVGPNDRWCRYMIGTHSASQFRLIRRSYEPRDWQDVFLLKPRAKEIIDRMTEMNSAMVKYGEFE